jgi:hypothetical protein
MEAGYFQYTAVTWIKHGVVCGEARVRFVEFCFGVTVGQVFFQETSGNGPSQDPLAWGVKPVQVRVSDLFTFKLKNGA